jgi:FkbM family methyltransferase
MATIFIRSIKLVAFGVLFLFIGAYTSSLAASTEKRYDIEPSNAAVDNSKDVSPAQSDWEKRKQGVVQTERGNSIHLQMDRVLHTQKIGNHEILLVSLVVGLMREEGLIPEGMFLDAGAQFGEQGAHYAATAPDRQVLCIDPSPRNLQTNQENYSELPNLRVQQGGLGKTVGVAKPVDSSFHMDLDAEFPVYTLDSLFYDKNEKLGFAHLDVEGLELDVIKGGLKTIHAYKPIFTTELRVHANPEYTKELLTLLDQNGYDSYVIHEVCGYPHMDYRNLLNVPRKMSTQLGMSDTFNLLLATQSIVRVSRDTIFENVFPCCAVGGECCPGKDPKANTCCSESAVAEWHEKNNVFKRPPAMFGWKTARKEFETWHWRLRERNKIA